MSDTASRGRIRTAFLVTASAAALALPAVAQAQSGPESAEDAPAIVPSTGVNQNAPAPGGLLDAGVNGVGQMIVLDQRPNGTFLGLCTGTLVNPRTVIFAAHCVNTRDASAYGARTGTSGGITNPALTPSVGTPISFGFSATNRCVNATATSPASGCTVGTGPYERWRDSGYMTQTGSNIFNVNQVWYDPRSISASSCLPGTTSCFLEADVAMATLDTPASDIPTWAMLFSPLTGPTRAVITGYGTSGTSGTSGGNQSIDYRRRVAENMIDFLGSLDDRNDLFFGPGNYQGVSSLYQLDFDDPDPNRFANFNPAGGRFDFDWFGGTTLPGEGTTAGGDSGGPLFVDIGGQRVTTAVLSGGSRVAFTNPNNPNAPFVPPFSSYSTSSFYQPLFLYWDAIIANNPYVYASAKAGSGLWFDPSRWVQDMDPNYVVEVNGQLVNALPTVAAQGIATETPGFGETFFLGVSDGATGNTPNTTPAPFIQGGPGSTNFVPNNVAPVNNVNPALTVKARYYDVTLRNDGITVLDRAATIDKLSVFGPAQLYVTAPGNLTVLGDYTQAGGLLSVNGTVKSGETLFAGGVLQGNGTIDPTFMTVMGTAILPGATGFGYGTLTVKGDLALTSATFLQMEVNATSQDKIVVLGDAQNTGIAQLGGTLFVTKAGGSNPRDGQSYDIVTATGGVELAFHNVIGGIGSLRPTVTYGANTAVLTLNARRLRETVGSNPTAVAMAIGLDNIRAGGSYNALYNLFGSIDVMETEQLTETLSGLAPRVANLAQVETTQQKNMVLGMVSDRLSLMGTDRAQAGTLAVLGAPETLGLAVGQTSISGSSASQMSFARSLTSTRSAGKLPENMSGFISGGYEAGRPGEAGIATGGERSTWHIAMGLEMEAGSNLTLGTAFGYVNGRSNVIGTEAETRTSQAIAYGSYRLSKQAYVAGLASVTNTDIGTQRGVTDGLGKFNLNGDTHATSYDLQLETGYNFGIAKGLTLTPRAALRYSSTTIDGYRERGGEVALLVDDIAEKRLEARMGAQVSGSTKVFGWALTPHLAADRVQALSTNGSGLNVRFAEAAGFAFALPGFSTDRAWTEVKGGLSFAKGPLSFGASVQSSLGRDDYRDDRAVADFTFRF
jgi:subtilase-type serine protease